MSEEMTIYEKASVVMSILSLVVSGIVGGIVVPLRVNDANQATNNQLAELQQRQVSLQERLMRLEENSTKFQEAYTKLYLATDLINEWRDKVAEQNATGKLTFELARALLYEGRNCFMRGDYACTISSSEKIAVLTPVAVIKAEPSAWSLLPYSYWQQAPLGFWHDIAKRNPGDLRYIPLSFWNRQPRDYWLHEIPKEYWIYLPFLAG